ncbi:response regulator [Cryobacterium sp. TMT1-21]|uniref:Transcriptional regulatory protein n=1 Tax=Cryobacterium shii TaxID=1259235 RepID=A0AAQ2C7C6_9MICO|nr:MULTISPECIES: response regulator [Cryobacterium]TFC49260.1 response regulator [Cryobacterium shii]TFC83485.1 response regulator [Cryobacterium sp. TmT2-59]TFD16103.1 response regulator [Cryobacterium sp. TMT2-23]TFD16177.1 response regulator [Cryobacterium sp. TMT4-10]TFD18295.1 response regulator [Cryobacterium sp. TMT1-21]
MCDVLVVDDDFMVARAHERVVLQQPGFRVVGVAHSGAEALQLITELRPCLVLLDIYLPDMTGLDVIRRAREADHDVDFLVLSAAREAETIGAALQGGIVSYLLKPFKITELQSRLHGYAERRRLLTRPGQISQSDLDQALGATGSVAVIPPLPKGLSKETASLVEYTLVDSETDVAASECAETLGLSRVVARKYLEHFVHTGQAGVTLRYGQAGRPQRRYGWLGVNR